MTWARCWRSVPGGLAGVWVPVLMVGFLSQGCAAPGDGVRPQTGAPRTVRIQGTQGGDVYLMSEIARGTFQLAASLQEVWALAPALFQELGVEVTYQVPGSHAIGNGGFRVRRIGGVRNSSYLDCGYGSTAVPHADGYEVTGSLITVFRPSEEGTTVMETAFSASARAREVSGGDVRCTSTGRLEGRMAEILAGLLAG